MINRSLRATSYLNTADIPKSTWSKSRLIKSCVAGSTTKRSILQTPTGRRSNGFLQDGESIRLSQPSRPLHRDEKIQPGGCHASHAQITKHDPEDAPALFYNTENIDWTNADDIDWRRTSWEKYRALLKMQEEAAQRVISRSTSQGLDRYRADRKWDEDKLQRTVTQMIRNWCRRTWYAQLNLCWREHPEQAFILLHLAFNDGVFDIPPIALGSYFKRLVRCFLQSANPPTALHIKAIHQLACDYISMAARCERPMLMGQSSIHLIQAHCSHEQMKTFFQTLLTYKVPLKGKTLLHFMERFVQKGELPIAFEVLRNAVSMGTDTSSYALQSCCVQFLRAASESRSETTTSSEIYDQSLGQGLIELGIKPNQILWTCIIQAAIKAGNFEEAWRWYDMGVLEGLKPNRITLSVLLIIAKQGPDQGALDRVIDIATEEGILPHDLDLVFDILHAVYVVNQSDTLYHPAHCFELVLSYYSRYCDIEPLRDLGLPYPSVDQGNTDFSVSQPSSLIIGMVLMAYVRSRATSRTILPLYQQYREYVAAKHPLFAPLANTDHIGNAFIKALGSQHDYLQYATLVVKDMLASVPFGDTPALAFKGTNPQNGGKPTVQTWNILVDCYMKQGFDGAAEKVLAMMRSRNIVPDVVTWNSIMAGYARRQDVDGVVEATRQMQDAGLEQDDYTIRALRLLHDKAEYVNRMEDGFQEDAEPPEERKAMGVA
ncbi:MAG: hypothetical protein Q9191_006106 [Dirinaria sp. TL-2023a]